MMKKLLLLLFVVPSIIFAQSINSWDGVKNGFYSTSHVKTLNIFLTSSMMYIPIVTYVKTIHFIGAMLIMRESTMKRFQRIPL